MIKEFPFYIDDKLKHKLDILYKQLNKKDIWILCSGDEGSGKTNTATYLLYYFHCLSGRNFTIENFYFDAGKLFEYAQKNKEELLNWDEGALGGLSVEWWNRNQINLIKLAITGRKLHHVFIICIPRFEKLKEELRVDRVHAHIHMDCGKMNNKYGHYIYLTRRANRFLNRLWKEKKLRLYGKAMKHGGFGGYIPFIFDKVFTKEEQDKYETNKDEAIRNIGKKDTKDKEKIKELKHKIGKLELPIKNRTELAKKLGITLKTLERWEELEENSSETLENEEKLRQTDIIINNE